MDSPTRDFGLDRDELVRALRRWASVVVAATFVAGLAAFGVSKLLPAQFEATAQLYLAAPAANSTVLLQDVNLGPTLAASYVQLAQSDVVLRPVMDQIGWAGDIKSFRDRLSVAQLRNTSIITVSFQSSDPERAVTVANAITNTFIEQTKDLQASLQGSTADELDKQIKQIQDDMSSLDTQIAQLRAQLAATPKPGASPESRTDIQNQITSLDGQRQSKQTTYAQLLKTRDDMRLAQARAETTVSLWQPAMTPEEPVSPKILLNTLLGALAGGLVALGAVALISYLDDRLRDPEDVPRRLGAAPLGQVRLHAHPESTKDKLFVRDEPHSPEAEAIRGIRTNILFSNVDRPPRSLLITSALPGEGKSVLSANLALAFAEAGTPVVLIDADLRRPSQHRLFRVGAATGLTTLLTSPITPEVLQKLRISQNLIFIPSGPIPPNPVELLGSARMTSFIQQLTTSTPNTMVIIDTSPVLAVADPLVLSTKVDGTIVVVDSSKTRVASARRALVALERVHAHVTGVVLNKLAEREAAYYRYEGYYGTGAGAGGGRRDKGSAAEVTKPRQA